MLKQLICQLTEGDHKAIARCISIVENGSAPSEALLEALPAIKKAKLIGFTGPPGAGKSTLVNTLIGELLRQGKKVAVLATDPSSPFNFGALLGDRIRMSNYYNHPDVFIRSLASRGALGGLPPKIIEITEVLQAAPFDYIFIETVGVGQSEVEIAGIADVTVVVLVPEAGDEIQTMKAGLMEIADIFVVNKADRANADEFARHLRYLAHEKAGEHEIPVLKTIATDHKGIDELSTVIIKEQHFTEKHLERRAIILAEKTFQLIQSRRMEDIDRQHLQKTILQQLKKQEAFQLYQFARRYY